MSFTYNLSNNIGRVRRSIPDKSATDFIWTDEEIQSFLDDEDDNWRRATASILEAMASDDVIILKVVKIQNIETNADRIMAALLKRAQVLREEAAKHDVDDGSDFAVAEVIVNDFQYREKLYGSSC